MRAATREAQAYTAPALAARLSWNNGRRGLCRYGRLRRNNIVVLKTGAFPASVREDAKKRIGNRWMRFGCARARAQAVTRTRENSRILREYTENGARLRRFSVQWENATAQVAVSLSVFERTESEFAKSNHFVFRTSRK